MGVVLFLVAAAGEMTFAMLCLRTRSSQRRTRSYLQLATLGVFALLAMVGLVEGVRATTPWPPSSWCWPQSERPC
jgi:hypothetical protein